MIPCEKQNIIFPPAFLSGHYLLASHQMYHVLAIKQREPLGLVANSSGSLDYVGGPSSFAHLVPCPTVAPAIDRYWDYLTRSIYIIILDKYGAGQNISSLMN